MDGGIFTFPQKPQSEPASFHGVQIPAVPEARLASIAGRQSRNDDAKIIAEFEFAQVNRDLKAWLSQMATAESEANDAEAEYKTFAANRRKTKSHYRRKDADKSRPVTWTQRLFHFGLFLAFLGALGFVSFSTANFVIDADLYPALQGNILAACLTTGIVVTVFIGGPIVWYALIETDEDRSKFARKVTRAGLVLGFVWVILFASVDALDNYVITTLTPHPFHGALRFVNSLLPALEGGAKFLMIPAQILGEAFGAVAIELHASAIRDACKKITMEAKEDYANLRDSATSARQIAIERRREAARLTALREEFDSGLAMFIAQCLAWLDMHDERQSLAARAGKLKFLTDVIEGKNSHA